MINKAYITNKAIVQANFHQGVVLFNAGGYGQDSNDKIEEWLSQNVYIHAKKALAGNQSTGILVPTMGEIEYIDLRQRRNDDDVVPTDEQIVEGMVAFGSAKNFGNRYNPGITEVSTFHINSKGDRIAGLTKKHTLHVDVMSYDVCDQTRFYILRHNGKQSVYRTFCGYDRGPGLDQQIELIKTR